MCSARTVEHFGRSARLRHGGPTTDTLVGHAHQRDMEATKALANDAVATVVRRAQHGDVAAFETLVAAQAGSIYRLARAFVGDAGADDVSQDVFIAAWRALPRLRDPERFGPWLHRIALNRCRSAVRGPGRVREIRPLDDTVDVEAAGDFRDGVEARDVVGPAFRRLTHDQRAIVALHYAAGLSIRECGEAMGVPEGTAKSRLGAALQSLRLEIGRVDR